MYVYTYVCMHVISCPLTPPCLCADLCGEMKGDSIPLALRHAMDWVDETWVLAGKDQNQVSKDDNFGRWGPYPPSRTLVQNTHMCLRA